MTLPAPTLYIRAPWIEFQREFDAILQVHRRDVIEECARIADASGGAQVAAELLALLDIPSPQKRAPIGAGSP